MTTTEARLTANPPTALAWSEHRRPSPVILALVPDAAERAEIFDWLARTGAGKRGTVCLSYIAQPEWLSSVPFSAVHGLRMLASVQDAVARMDVQLESIERELLSRFPACTVRRSLNYGETETVLAVLAEECRADRIVIFVSSEAKSTAFSVDKLTRKLASKHCGLEIVPMKRR